MAELAGAVLTGGSSRRMGRDKAFVPVAGHPLVLRPAAALRDADADPVFAVGGDLGRLRSIGLDAIADRRQGEGPLAGIVAALVHARSAAAVVVLACDLVGASPAAVRAVVDGLAAAPDAAVAVPVAGGRIQPLHAAWRPSAAPVLEAALDRGERAVRSVFDALAVVSVPDLDPAWFVNANSPADLGQTGTMSEDAPVPEIDVEELARRQATGSYVLDVRQPDEYEAGHVPGAVLIPLDQLADRRGEVPADRPLLVICRSGGRSAAAVQALAAAGHDATNVAGGTLAWIEAGHPVVTGPEAG